MTTYAVEDLKRDIRVALDQNMISDQLFDTGDIDTLSLEEIIESKIEDAARVVMRDAPAYLLGGGVNFGDSIGWFSQAGYGGGYIQLPDDFLRLVSFQMSDWSRAVTNAISEDDPLYVRQSSRFPGIRGNTQNPVVAIVMHTAGLMLEFYSCSSGNNATIKRATYIPIPKIENGYIEISEKLRPAVVHYAAYLTAITVGQADIATALLNISKDLMQ